MRTGANALVASEPAPMAVVRAEKKVGPRVVFTASPTACSVRSATRHWWIKWTPNDRLRTSSIGGKAARNMFIVSPKAAMMANVISVLQPEQSKTMRASDNRPSSRHSSRNTTAQQTGNKRANDWVAQRSSATLITGGPPQCNSAAAKPTSSAARWMPSRSRGRSIAACACKRHEEGRERRVPSGERHT